MIVELSKKQYPTSLKISLDMQHLNASPNPDSMRLLNRGVITIAQISGEDPFPWTSY